MKAFVTGSTGLLGSNLVQLLVEQGFEVKALARSRQKAEKLLGKNAHIQIVQGDMEDIDGFVGELADCDVLFHVAAYFREYYSPGDHWAKLKGINVDGTIRLLTEAERSGIKKAIYVSSGGVLGGAPDGKLSDESTPPDQYVFENLYTKSKMLAEEAIANWLKTHRMPVVLILPTAIVGPRDAAPTTLGQAIVDLVSRKIPAIPPGGFEFVDARDVSQAMINAVECGRSGERYIISTGYYTMHQVAQTVERISGVPAPRLRMPYPLMLGFALVTERIAMLRGKPAQISSSAIRLMRRPRRVSMDKAKRELGIRPRSFEDSLRDEVKWFQANGYVKG